MEKHPQLEKTSSIDDTELSISSLIEEIDSIAAESSGENWDGYGASSISRKAVEFSKSFIRNLPVEFSNPEISPEPDGSIGLEWHLDAYRWIIVSFNGNGDFFFASQIDSKTKFDGRGVINSPRKRDLVDAIRRVMSNTEL